MKLAKGMLVVLCATAVLIGETAFNVVPATGSTASSPADIVATVAHAAGTTTSGRASGSALLPVLASTQKPVYVGTNAVYQNVAPDTSYVVRPTATGTQTLIDITGSKAPSSFTFAMPLPAGVQYKLTQEGSINIVSANGAVIGALAKPWAKDANGKAVGTNYTLKGNDVVQTVDYHGAAFPVVADPSIRWQWWGYQIVFTKWETQAISWGAGAIAVYFGWTGWLAVAAYAGVGVASWATSNGYCLEENYYWGGWAWGWATRC